ncbi:unnamed protein product [Paramecium sonneborni]|uniref:Uncharacterized protein n=1 Tax=Paramecium sonneborni TaxID=65129 RepID=A0A8S1RAH6_9CILI|nr:unnamed protein product [Paramecium sonneborni]
MRKHNSDDQIHIKLIEDNDQLTLISEFDEDHKQYYFLRNSIYYTEKLLQLLITIAKTKKNNLIKDIQNLFSKQQQHIRQYLSQFKQLKNQILSKEELIQNYEKVKSEFKSQSCKAFSIYQTQDEQLSSNNTEQLYKESQQQDFWSINENINTNQENLINQSDNSFKIYSDLEQNQIQISFPKRVSQDYQKDLLKKLDEIANNHQYQIIQLK